MSQLPITSKTIDDIRKRRGQLQINIADFIQAQMNVFHKETGLAIHGVSVCIDQYGVANTVRSVTADIEEL